MKIVLIGFMGAGKTSLAKRLSEELELEYVDMDNMIIRASGRSTDTEIFDKDSEDKFRQLETAIAQRLRSKEKAVISTGGGVVINDINMKYLKENGIIVFLKNSFSTSQSRISKKNPPPLFRDKKRAKLLYELRLPLYTKHADYIIETDKMSLDEIIQEIINKIKK